VGGGYPRQGLSLVALHWMMGKAEAAGLRFVPGALRECEIRQNVHDKLYDSRAGLGVLYRRRPRDIERMCSDHGVRPKIHASVLERRARLTGGYAPCNLPAEFDVVETGAASPAEDGLELEHRVG
jgi:hypothetical protein